MTAAIAALSLAWRLAPALPAIGPVGVWAPAAVVAGCLSARRLARGRG